MSASREQLARACTEDQLLAWILELADVLDWLAYHTHDSRRSRAGFPDLVLVRDRRIIFAELKSQTGKTSIKQIEWLGRLDVVSELATHYGPDDRRAEIGVHLWRPMDWFNGRISEILIAR